MSHTLQSITSCREYAAVLAVMVGIGAAGCGETPTPAGPRPTAQGASQDKVAVRTIDDEFVALAGLAPGFGGMFFDSLGRLNIYLKNPASLIQAEGPVREFLTRGRLPGSADAFAVLANVQVHVARYDFAELAGLYERLAAVAADRGVTQTDIDETQNRIVVGVANDAVAGRIRLQVARLGLPDDAVSVEVIAPTNTVASLQGMVRPVPSSVQIGTPSFLCTLGWNAYRRDESGIYDGQRYFFTNSHCTDVFGAVDGVTFGQPTVSSPIGVEVLDPPMVTNFTNADCPPGDSCRYSDAAVVLYDGGVAWNHGRIPTVSGGAPFNITMYRDIGGGASEYDLIVGRTAYKTGRTTGTTSGTVTASCVRTREFENGVPTDRVMLCQMQASQMAVGPGDSGSPVYLTDVPGGLHLVGILWGTADTLNLPASPVRTTFSRWYMASLEMKVAAGGDSFVDVWFGACQGCGY